MGPREPKKLKEKLESSELDSIGIETTDNRMIRLINSIYERKYGNILQASWIFYEKKIVKEHCMENSIPYFYLDNTVAYTIKRMIVNSLNRQPSISPDSISEMITRFSKEPEEFYNVIEYALKLSKMNVLPRKCELNLVDGVLRNVGMYMNILKQLKKYDRIGCVVGSAHIIGRPTEFNLSSLLKSYKPKMDILYPILPSTECHRIR